MKHSLVYLAIPAYFGILFLISWFTGKNATEKTFFTGDRASPWYLVAFGMIGASLSGVTFISVPGWVATQQFAYMQMVLGYLVGYAVIALILLPLYYKMNLTSIYGYLEERFGTKSYKTGAFFFLLSRTIGASFRLFLVAIVFKFILDKFFDGGVPFAVPVFISIVLIYLYTFRGGIKTVVWTDTLQTLFMLLSAGLAVWWIGGEMDLSMGEMVETVRESKYSTWFFGGSSGRNFISQFLSGAFIAIVMTGLDQDMMQKNLTCRTLGDAQKNIFSFSFVLVFVNLGFLSLGALLFLYGAKEGITQELMVDGKFQLMIQDPATGEMIARGTDELFPVLALDYFPPGIGIIFILGLVAAAYSSADSAMAALTTSFCIDFLDFEKREDVEEKKKTRYYVHMGFSVLIFVVILLFQLINDQAVIASIFKAAGYTYGPLLGLYAFGLFTPWKVKDNFVPYVCLAAPLLSFGLDKAVPFLFDFSFGFMILLVNGILTFLGLLLIREEGRYQQ